MENNGTEKKSGVTAIIIGIVVLLCCVCVLVLGMVGYGYYAYTQVAPTLSDKPIFPPMNDVAPASEEDLFRPSSDTISTETVQTLDQSIVPENDVYELACRLQGICDVAKTLDAPAVPLSVGTTQKFWLINADTNENFQINATLRYITPLTYFWAEEGVDVNEDDMKALMDKFDQEIIPTNREFFGSEWTPGVDNDPHIYVLYVGGLGSNIGGYYSSSDEYNPLVRQYSNGIESFVLTSSQPLGDEYAYSTLAHEFVHMIQFAADIIAIQKCAEFGKAFTEP